MSQRIYEIAFSLGASISPSVRAAFAKANQEIKRFSQTAQRVGAVTGKFSLVVNGLAGITAAAGPATAAVGALGASFAAAGAGAVAYGVVAASAISKVVEASEEVAKIEEKIKQADSAKERIAAQKELAAIYANMSAEQRKALKNLQEFKSFWSGFVQSFEKPIFQAFGTSLQIAKNGLNLLKPTIANVSDVMVELTEKFNKVLQGPTMKGFFEWLSTNAPESIYNFAHVFGNSFRGMMNLFQAFSPLGASMEEGLVGMTRRFAEWSAGLSNSKAFQSFIDYAKQNGPTLLRIIGNVATFVKNLGVLLAPLGAKVLDVLEVITGFAAKLTSTITNMDGFRTKAMEVFGKVSSFILGVFQRVSSFWNENGSSIISGLSKVISGFMGIIQAILPIVVPIVKDIISFVGGIVKQIAQFWKENGAQIVQAVQNLFGIIAKIIKFFAPVIVFILSSILENVKGLIRGALNVIMGFIKVFAGLFTGDFSKMWEGAKQIFIGAIQVIWNAVNLLLIGKVLGGIKALATGALSKVSTMWTSIKEFFSGGATAIWQRIVGLGPKLQTGFNNIKNKAVEFAKNMWSKINEHFGNIVEGAKSLPGKIGKGISSMAGKALEGAISMGNKLLKEIGKIINGVIKGLNYIMGKVGLDIKINTWEVPQYAKGTNYHPGGPAIVGEKGRELIHANGQTFLAKRPMLLNLPKGASVLPNKQTEQLLAAGIPGYAKGVGNFLKDAVGKVKEIGIDVWSYISEPSKLLNKVLEKFGFSIPSFLGAIGHIAVGSFKLVKGKALDFLKKKLGDFGSFKGGVAAPEQVKSWIIQALRITGTPLSWLPAMLVKAQKESGFNPRAINLWDINAKRGTPSKGLFQTIDPTFNRYKLPGMDNIWNPVHNAVAAIRYIKARYGTVFNTPGIKSMARGGKYKGYYQGGRVPYSQWAWVGERGPELLKLPGGSEVFSHEKSKSIISRILSFAQSNHNSTKNKTYESERPIEVIFSPQIVIKGDADEGVIQQALGFSYEEFKRFMKQWERDKKRLAFE
jgi:SLT domain-containing protein/phage-related protein